MYNLGEEYKKINEKIKPPDGFTEKLKTNVINKANERKLKKVRFIQTMAACFILVFISRGVFAKDIENLMARMFSNINRGIEVAVENDYIQNLNMGYVIDKGINIKADYILDDNNNFDIVFNVKTDIEFDEIYFEEIIITNKDGNIIYNSNYENGEGIDNNEDLFETVDKIDKRLSKSEMIKTYIIYSIIDKYGKLENIKIDIKKINIIKEHNSNIIDGNWSFDININKNIFYDDIVNCAIEETDLLENHNVYLTNTEMKIDLLFKEDLSLKDIIKTRKQLLIQDENGKTYYCNDLRNIENNRLRISFPINKFENTNNFEFKIFLESEILVFKIKTE